MIRMHDVCKHFKSDMLRRRKEVIRNLSFHVKSGETYALLGANGAGKTTTMKLLLDLIRPDSGEVTIEGNRVSNPDSRRAIGYIPERPYFFPHLTGEELVRYYAKLSGIGKTEIRARSTNLLLRLGLRGAETRKIRTYSKGMLQRLGFAQLLVANPRILILDEPLSGLDPVGRKEIRELLLEEKELGRTIFISSHILEDVEKICDRAGFLVKGTIQNEVESGKTDVVEVDAARFDSSFLEEADLIVETIARMGENVRFRLKDESDLTRIHDLVRRHGGEIVAVNRNSRSLEDLFVENVLSHEGEVK